MCNSERGFTLLETLVAMLLSVTVVLSVGVLGSRLAHRRSSSASISAATSLAELTIEQLRPLRVPWTMTNGTTSQLVDASGTITVGGPYSRTTEIADGPSLTVGGTIRSLKHVTVTVTHTTNPEIRVQLVSYFRISA